MRVEWAIPCLGVQQQPDGLLNLAGASFTRIAVRQLPGQVRFIIALRLIGEPEDFAEDASRMIRAPLLGPDMEPITELEFEVPHAGPELHADHPPGWERSLNLPLGVQYMAEQEGRHSIDFYVNEKFQAGRSVAVWVAEQPPQPPAENA
ncbi:MAG: DUF6941 family protein [Gaiellaceae bacterium]